MRYWTKIKGGEAYESKLTPKKEYADTGTYTVDDSHFIPMSELVKRNAQTGPLRLGNDVVENYYDFPDGKDTGLDVTNRNTKNIAELAKITREGNEKIQKEITREKERQRAKEEAIKPFNQTENK